jgi:hypothetical protein
VARLAVDGYMLDHGADRLSLYFDAAAVRDPARDEFNR